MQVEKIEATYAYLQQHSPGICSDKISVHCLPNQDLVQITERIKLHQGGKLDYEMVINVYFKAQYFELDWFVYMFMSLLLVEQ